MKKKILEERSRVSLNKKISAAYFEISLETSNIAENSLPGQFIEIKSSSSLDPLLRRPLSIHWAGHLPVVKSSRHKKEDIQTGTLKIIYEVVGKGTEILSQKRPGDFLDIIGPLGNGFSFLTSNSELRTPVLISGGMGVAPLLFLAEKLVHSRQPTAHRRPLVVIGARTKEGILCEQEFKKLGCDVKVATDDGSQGFKGRVTDLLSNLLSAVDCRLSTIYACGPKPMLKALTQISKQYNMPAQISLESHMACGIGACLGCVVNTSCGFKRVCKDGPVFKAEEIIW